MVPWLQLQWAELATLPETQGGRTLISAACVEVSLLCIWVLTFPVIDVVGPEPSPWPTVMLALVITALPFFTYTFLRLRARQASDSAMLFIDGAMHAFSIFARAADELPSGNERVVRLERVMALAHQVSVDYLSRQQFALYQIMRNAVSAALIDEQVHIASSERFRYFQGVFRECRLALALADAAMKR